MIRIKTFQKSIRTLDDELIDRCISSVEHQANDFCSSMRQTHLISVIPQTLETHEGVHHSVRHIITIVYSTDA